MPFARHMRPWLAAVAGLATVAAAFAESLSAPAARTVPDLAASATPRTLTTQFTYTATVPAPPAGTRALDLWLPIPSDSPWQTVTGITVQSPIPYTITREPKFGDRMVFLHDIAPAVPLRATVQFTVKRREARVLDAPAGTTDEHPSDFPPGRAALQPEKRVPVGGRFQTIARRVTQGQGTTLAKERTLFDSVITTMHYDYNKTSPEYAQGDAAFVCDFKSGNCSDLHSYLIALSRSVGIPAIMEFGFPLTSIPLDGPPPTDGAVPGYHCWVWFQDARHGWVPQDAADGRRWRDAGDPQVAGYLFGNLVLERSAVAMSRGRDLTLQPPQKDGPLNYFIYPYAEADGKAVDATWKLTYHIVSRTP